MLCAKCSKLISFQSCSAALSIPRALGYNPATEGRAARALVDVIMTPERAKRDSIEDWRNQTGERLVTRPREESEPPFSSQEPDGLPTEPNLEAPAPPTDLSEPLLGDGDDDFDDLRDTIPAPVPPEE